MDAPTCKNIVLARVVDSMTEFKQIIGRGTRVRDDYGKFWFNIIDYTGSATRMFADPAFDGEPVRASLKRKSTKTARRRVPSSSNLTNPARTTNTVQPDDPVIIEPPTPERRKYLLRRRIRSRSQRTSYTNLTPTGKPTTRRQND